MVLLVLYSLKERGKAVVNLLGFCEGAQERRTEERPGSVERLYARDGCQTSSTDGQIVKATALVSLKIGY